MSIPIDGLYYVRKISQDGPGKNALFALERKGWVEVDGVREQKLSTMAVYSSKVLLVRDLVSDAAGCLVLQGKMDAITAFVSEARRLAEAAQVAFDNLKQQQTEHV